MVKVGLTIASDVDEIIHDLSLCLPAVPSFRRYPGHFSGGRPVHPGRLPRIEDYAGSAGVPGVSYEEQWPTILT